MNTQNNASCAGECGAQASCRGCSHNPAEKPSLPHKIGKVIAVSSGKGGVGKSTVSAKLAVALRRAGYTVGLLDADITGPSIPKMFGPLDTVPSDGERLMPAQTRTGIRVISINLLLEDEAQPVIWRGPMIAGVALQFWNDVYWGELDVLIIDMPPGTGDVPLSIYQSIPVDGTLVVATPQDLVGMVVAKAVHMAKKMEIPVLGLIENMAYLACPHCGEHVAVFGPGGAAKLAQTLGIPALAALPLDAQTAAACDEGRIEDLQDDAMAELALTVAAQLGLPGKA